DKMERARRQTTGRLGVIGEISSIAQELVTMLSLAAGLLWFSPWLLALLFIAILPAFLGETHFASLSYSLLYRRTPERRELDYLRMLGASHLSAKEVKIFGLGRYLAERYRRLADGFYRENRSLAARRAAVGAALSLLGTGAYYGAFVVILGRTLSGLLSVGDLTFLVGAFARSRTLMESMFASLSNISERALFLGDLYDFFHMTPTMVSGPDAVPAPRSIRDGFEFQDVSFHYPGTEKLVIEDFSFRLEPGERLALIGENGAGKT
ncbi:MAG: ABC transporter ATP-binding protein, partial [bacterium]|nr:ABC transporter ATP-binding protein [bacterium]